MKRSYVFIYLLLLSALCFAQQNAGIRVIGRIPDAEDSNLYQMQVGAFRVYQNASSAFEKLKAASLNPSYEEYNDLTRVLIKGVKARDVPAYIERIRRTGFSEVFIKIGSPGAAAARLPSAVYVPPEDSYISGSQPDMLPRGNGSENAFSGTGLWKLTGHDPAGAEWKADIVIENVRNNNFDGYFNWYMGPDFDYSGKEYFTGQFDKNTDKIFFQGTRLENSRNLVLGKYEAYVSVNKDKLYNGRWEEADGIPTSDWQAVKAE
jgi:hypothetical protein